MQAITAMNFLHPTPIQAATIPIALMGRDIYGCAATGTGKFVYIHVFFLHSA